MSTKIEYKVVMLVPIEVIVKADEELTLIQLQYQAQRIAIQCIRYPGSLAGQVLLQATATRVV